MKKHILYVYLLLASMVAQSQVKHVILISIDGLRPEFYLDKRWPAPHLQRLQQVGVYAKEVKSVFPSVTFPAHTTIITGAYPAKHGIYYNEPYGGSKGHWYWNESYIKVPTLWDAVKGAGLTSAAVMWPVSVGAPVNYNFPPRRAEGEEKGDQLQVSLPYITPGLLADVQRYEGRKFTANDFDANNTSDITIGKIGSYILQKYKPNFTALHFVTVDHLQHDHGRDGAEVKRAVALVDSMIGEVIKTIKDAGVDRNTAIIITGDHGFVDTYNSFSPNTLLYQNNLHTTNGGNANFHSAGGAAFLYLKDRNDNETTSRVKALMNELPTEQKKAFRILDREELDKAGANPEVAIALAMSKGFVASNDLRGELIKKKNKGGAHGYYPDFDDISTGFIAVGAGIGRPKEIAGLAIKDIAPLVSGLLGVSMPLSDGVLIPGILKK